jgi:hypothetical protein
LKADGQKPQNNPLLNYVQKPQSKTQQQKKVKPKSKEQAQGNYPKARQWKSKLGNIERIFAANF